MTWAWQMTATRRSVGTMPEKWKHVRHGKSQDTGAFSRRRHKTRGVTEIPPNSKDNVILSHCRWLRNSCVTLHKPNFQRQNHYRLAGWGSERFLSYFSTSWSFKPRPHWQATYNVCLIEFAKGMRLKIRYVHREQRKTKSKSISNL